MPLSVEPSHAPKTAEPRSHDPHGAPLAITPDGGVVAETGAATVPRETARRSWFASWRRRAGQVVTLWRWELASFWRRPSSYLLLLAATWIAGWSFSWLVTLLANGTGSGLRVADDPLIQFLGPNVFLVGLATLLVPILTMNSVAEERRRGTWELLLTSPISAGETVVAKFLALWCQWLVSIAPWPVFLLILRCWNGRTRLVAGVIPWWDGPGLSFDLGPMLGGTVGSAMIGATLVALGLLCSSLCRRPLSAALLSFVLMSLLLLAGFLPRALEVWGFAREQLAWVEYVSCWGHLESFSRGTILPRVIVGHASVVAVALWLTARWSCHFQEG
ncbi:MAG: ABC transporter permease [Planctomycetales bacterium]